jgi:hypothetical protein
MPLFQKWLSKSGYLLVTRATGFDATFPKVAFQKWLSKSGFRVDEKISYYINYKTRLISKRNE